MLSQHPDVSTCQETHLFGSFLVPMLDRWRVHATDGRGAGLQAVVSYEEFLALQRQLALSVLSRIGDTPIILEKSPSHTAVLDDIVAILPEARFIHIIRDPRAVAASLAAAAQDWGRRWASVHAVRNARRWHDSVAAAVALTRRDEARCHEVRYERLLVEPVQVLGQLFEWLGVEADEQLCDTAAKRTQIENLRTGVFAAPWDLTKEPKGFYRKGEADSWKQELRRRDIAIVEELTSPLLEELGYQLTTSGMSWDQRSAIRLREGLGWRLKALAARVGYL